MDNLRQELKKSKRIIIKIGTSSITYPTGLLNLNHIEKIVRQIADIHNRGLEIVLVTSGAIGAGMGRLGLKTRPKTIPEKQAAAAVGQGVLMHTYEKLFSEYSKTTAQILLTKEDMCDRVRFLNARNTFFSLFDKNVIPIVNENDAIIVDEIKFGDNDTLSSVVAGLVDADLLIILSDIDGLYDKDPRKDPKAKFINTVENITEDVENFAKGAGSSLGTGGMATKIKAAKIALSSGASMLILNGSIPNIISIALEGEPVGTLFHCEKQQLSAKKHWLAFGTLPKGKIYVDIGAEKFIKEKHKSLLPKGITKVTGIFKQGDVISIYNEDNKEIGRGITNYPSFEIEKILGSDSKSIEKILGYKSYDVVVHADNMAIL
ncbi:glutamate 5-kinase [Haloimpatiens sp. FM7315]|uniref:glutamate 5-kinase n=1 Tax=Haloimpatiens sp. FM7315 TaxID=3298609 RepID=UPI0035A3B5F5